MRADGSSGTLTIDVPEDAAGRLDVREGGSGGVRVPRGLCRFAVTQNVKRGHLMP
jgi:hypothetical protein